MGGIKIVVQSRRINGVEGQLPDHPMVSVEDILNIKGSVGRVVGEDYLGADLSDYPNKVSPKIQRILKLPIGFPQKNDFLGSNHASSGPLFFLP
jgi:hypothetical protein